MSLYSGLLVAVHAGAGFHSADRAQDYRNMCKKACLEAMETLKNKRPASEAVTAAVSVLEDADLSNAGRGSSLTLEGTVECDACIMDGQTVLFGAVGCVSGIQNPIQLAHCLLVQQQKSTLSLGRIPPSVLVGEGARQWAKEQGFSCDSFSGLITEKSRRMYLKYRRRVERVEAAKKTVEVPMNHTGTHSDLHSPEVKRKHVEGNCSFQDSGVNTLFQDERDLTSAISEMKSEVPSQNQSETFSLEYKIVDNDFTKECELVSERNSSSLQPPLNVNRLVAPLNETGERCSIFIQTADNSTHPGKDCGKHVAEETAVQDTVGALCIDWQGHISAAVSSGGIWLKQPGRLGPAAMFGTACWAQNGRDSQPSVAVIASGCGEHLMRTLLAKTCADCLVTAENTEEGLNNCFKNFFIGSPLLPEVDSKLAGAVAAVVKPLQDGLSHVELCWGHTTASMAVGYMCGDNLAPKTLISRQDENSKAGHSFAMSGVLISQ